MERYGTIFQYEPLWGAWHVDERISQSSSGEVYRVYKEEWGRRYISAVKLISLSIGRNDVQEAQAIGIDTASMAEYFKSYVGSIVNEVEMMYRLRGNSNIVAYEDHSIHEKQDRLGWDILIRMEYVEPLLDYMTVHALTNREIIKLGIDICEALEACAKERIIHRDIRDTGIFVSGKGDFKLGNFSIAKEVSKGGQAVPNRGNPLFMAPEIYKEQGYDATVDIYSLGIVMYKLLNRGRLPFLPLPPHPVSIDDTENSIRCRMVGCEPELPVDADEKLGRAILKACSYHPKDRYKSPAEFRQKLERIFKAEGRAGVKSKPEAIASADNPGKQLNDTEAVLSEIAVTSEGMVPEAARPSKKRLLLAACCSGAIILALGLMFGFSKPTEAEKPPMDTNTTTLQAHITPTAVPITAENMTPAENTAAAEPTASPAPTKAAGSSSPAENGKAYFNKGMAFMKNSEYANALKAFEQAKRLKYNSSKADQQISALQKIMAIQAQLDKAMTAYSSQDYEDAILCFAALANLDPTYKSTPEYEDSFFQLSSKYNQAGVRYYNDGRLEDAVKAFDTALNELDKMKVCLEPYDMVRYSKMTNVCEKNKSEVLERMKKIDAYLQSADTANRKGVVYFEEKSYDKAKKEFENAVKQLHEIRILVPKYSAGSYEDLLRTYTENLRHTENKLQ